MDSNGIIEIVYPNDNNNKIKDKKDKKKRGGESVGEREREEAGECQKPMVGFGRGLLGVWFLFVLSVYMDKCLRAYAFINLTKL